MPVVADRLVEQLGEHGPGCPPVEPHCHVQFSANRPIDVEPAPQVRLGIGTPTIGGVDAQPAEHQREGSVGDPCCRGETVDRRTDVFRGRSEAEIDLGEADTADRGPDRWSGVAGGGDGDRDRGRCTGRLDLDSLPDTFERRSVEVDANRGAIIDRQLDRRDRAIQLLAVRLAQRHMVDARLGAEFDELTDCAETVGDGPRGGRVTVDRHDRTTFGKVGERFAVGRRSSDNRTILDRHGLRVRVDRVGDVRPVVDRVEDAEALIAALEPQHVGLDVTGLREPGDVLRAAPVVRSVTIGVGHHQP